MTFTFTGRHVTPAGAETPSLTDIAVGLSRQPRFAGQGRRWFSVLDHSLFCDELARSLPDSEIPYLRGPFPEGSRAQLRLAALLHDAHEAITADVPTTWKNGAFKLQQGCLDVRIMEAYFPGGIGAYHETQDVVKRIDRRALVAEARVVGPPVSADRILDAFGITETVLDDVELLHDLLLGSLGLAPHIQDPQAEHPAVKAFLRRYIELR